MAIARVVTFDGVSADRMQAMTARMQEGEKPEDLPATEILVLHDPAAERAMVVLFFDSEDDYQRGDAALNAMEPGETPGRRTSVGKYQVAVRQTA